MSALDAPLVLVGGKTTPTGPVTYYMHEGYTRPLVSIELLTPPYDGQLWRVYGDDKNPNWKAPIYARAGK